VVSLPVGLSAEGLPLSVQVIAAPGGEIAALDFAAFLERLVIQDR
jgi:amidase